MERHRPQEQLPRRELGPEQSTPRTRGFLEAYLAPVLEGQSYEDAAAALATVGEFRSFRQRLKTLPFSSFGQLFGDIKFASLLQLSADQRAEVVDDLITRFEDNASGWSPRVADFALGLAALLRQEAYKSRFPATAVKLQDLVEQGDILSAVDPSTPWDVTFNRLESRLVGFLRGARGLDRRDGKLSSTSHEADLSEGASSGEHVTAMQEPSRSTSSLSPSSRQRELKPGMDPMERLKEGERAEAIWAIRPPYGGYYRGETCSMWDSVRNTWVEPNTSYTELVFAPLPPAEVLTDTHFVFTSTARYAQAGVWITIPTPYTHAIHTIDVEGRAFHAQQDQAGAAYVFIEGSGNATLTVTFVPQPGKSFSAHPADVTAPKMPAQFTAETLDALQKIEEKYRFSPMRQAHRKAAYTRRHLRYSNDKACDALYAGFPKGYFAGIDEVRKADCDVANTYYAALLAHHGRAARIVSGHSVKGAVNGEASMHSGTGHAWLEVFDPATHLWKLIDATPPGDPNLDTHEEQTMSKLIPGDYGDQEVIMPTEQALQALHEQLAQHTERLSYTPEERRLAEAGNVSLPEARKILREIAHAESIQLSNGERITDVLALLFQQIIETRRASTLRSRDPVTRAEGGEEIVDLVPHFIAAVRGNERDPATRRRPEQRDVFRRSIAGFDVILIGDKSGSMSALYEGEALWEMQRTAAYLIFSALSRFQKNIDESSLPAQEALLVRTQGISFRGAEESELDTDKPLSSTLSSTDKVRMWNSLTQRGGGNGDVQALEHVLAQIQREDAQLAARGDTKRRLRLVFACSDGEPDRPEYVRTLAQAIGETGAMVVGLGLTETALKVPLFYTTSHSTGELVPDIHDLPAVIARHIVAALEKLFPERVAPQAHRIIDQQLRKFSS